MIFKVSFGINKELMQQVSEFTDNLRIRLTRKIAEGGMGAVYECQILGPEGFEKTAAVKMIKERYTKDADFVERFVGEAKLVANLVHENIVQIYKLGKIGNSYVILMEYVHGVNLQEFMNRHLEQGLKVPVDLGCFIISRICRGLEYAHNKRDKHGIPLGVVHRDISPKNLMISSEGQVKITDFGVAKARNLMKDDEGVIVVGKVSYMSPEQAQFMPTDRRSDLFSLGVVMYELLTGERLFGGSSDTKIIIDNVISKKLPKPSEKNPLINEDLEKILIKSLDRDPKRRYSDAGEMVYDLEYFIYHKGYGPTIKALELYMRQHFKAIYANENPNQRRQSDEETERIKK